MEFMLMMGDEDANGIPFSWYPIRELIATEGVLCLETVFDWYEHRNPEMHSLFNYGMALSHFEAELTSTNARKMRRYLEHKIAERNEKKKNLRLQAKHVIFSKRKPELFLGTSGSGSGSSGSTSSGSTSSGSTSRGSTSSGSAVPSESAVNDPQSSPDQ
jgi:uncharacterized membrane protein YgcG